MAAGGPAGGLKTMVEHNDLIHKGKALKDLRGIKDVLLAQGDPFLAAIMNRAVECIENQPTVDAAPIPPKEGENNARE